MNEPWHRDLRWRVAALVFGTLLLVGLACAGWGLQQLQGQQTRAAQQHAQAMAESVAHTLAQQLGRAVRLGIPLDALPGLQPHLQQALQQQAALSGIRIHLADEQLLLSVGTDSGQAVAWASIASTGADHGPTVGRVQVSASGGRSASLQQARWLAALGVLGVAALSAALAAFSVGARLERQRRLVWQQLTQADSPGLDNDRLGLPVTDGPLALLQALAAGQHALAQAQQALEAQAQELLAVDFDGHMQARIEAIRQDANALESD